MHGGWASMRLCRHKGYKHSLHGLALPQILASMCGVYMQTLSTMCWGVGSGTRGGRKGGIVGMGHAPCYGGMKGVPGMPTIVPGDVC